MEEDGDHTKTRRKRTRDVTPPGLKRPPPPREEGDPYDELLDYDSDTYEYRWGWERPTRRYKLSDFVDGGTWSPPTADEARREHELTMAERRDFLSRGAEPLRINRRPRFLGLGGCPQDRLPTIYRQPASTAQGTDVGAGSTQ